MLVFPSGSFSSKSTMLLELAKAQFRKTEWVESFKTEAKKHNIVSVLSDNSILKARLGQSL